MPSILIRQAVPDDAAIVLAMMHQLLDEPHLNLSRETFQLSLEDEREFLRRIVASTSDVYFVALDGEQAVGNIWMRGSIVPARAHCAEVGISVVPSHRSRGIGLRLLGAGLAWARERGLRRVELKVYAENEGARRLYERVGFQIEGQHRDLFHKGGRFSDALSMALIFDAPSAASTCAGA